tara:strand:+ start:887 stop:1810 length:924 start_codon:yes stop_codon:yes gene_type:complete
MSSLFIIAPTFKEVSSVARFFNSIKRQETKRHIVVFICNANPGDETSELLLDIANDEFRVKEVQGKPDEFWTATVDRGVSLLRSQSLNANDIALIANIDIEFDATCLSKIEMLMDEKQLSIQIGGLGHNLGVAISSGVKLKSLFFGINQHPLAGMELKSLTSKEPIKVDYLPGRCIALSAQKLISEGFVDSKKFPHYGADYVFSAMLGRTGCDAFVLPTARYAADVSNTGLSVYSKDSNFFDRLSVLFSKRNPGNPMYRIKFVLAIYDKKFWPTVIISFLLRTGIELILGGSQVKKIFGTTGRGYSK